ncbi:PREDICTED: uncharacterized protein LOC105459027 [Wasmannia auropunctata]|uniref:uncharacterized protein LOC105459027 n=1 Tax=Wasmannia auropunctata TaxID=64793 RepID=UPI0005EDBD5B|nr:PREDICTED: uncharacterized protein LOC105459027 [Wasmannia auropunctata]XP_011702993.1 PREDICTED: uncharacterized protein LOC105459027 [Wasmannia auropunctata]
MMTTIDASLFTLKKEQNACNNSDSDNSSDNIDDFSSVPLPSLFKNSVIVDESNNEFLHLTATVRAVYLSYLHKCLLSNYATCYKQNDDVSIERIEVKKCADQMELHAVQLALEANLYRQNMLKMINDVKSHTIKKKVYKKLVIFLETPKDKIDIAVQTDDTWMDLEGTNIQSISFMSNCEKSLPEIALPIMNYSNFCKSKNAAEDFNDEADMQMLQSTAKEKSNNASPEFNDEINSHIMDNVSIYRNEDENSRDSLLQHMQDMFCESDDSSDLTRLIEKHSGVTKANIDKEINKICSEADIIADSNLFHVPLGNNVARPNVAKVNTSEGRISFSRYKEMQSRRSIKLKGINANETAVESKQKQKINAIWFVERVHQVSKLKAKMTELSLTNYRRHGIVKEKFLRLFGEFEEEEMMPDSPICIEEHLPACKERIAPWIVKYLMPFYKKRRIKDRQLFKAVAKYITDMLIIENTFPEQECVNKYIEDYFKNKKFIKTKQDIYL